MLGHLKRKDQEKHHMSNKIILLYILLYISSFLSSCLPDETGPWSTGVNRKQITTKCSVNNTYEKEKELIRLVKETCEDTNGFWTALSTKVFCILNEDTIGEQLTFYIYCNEKGLKKKEPN